MAALLAALLPAAAGPNPNLPLDCPFTQREAASGLLEGEYRRQIVSDVPLSFLFPRPHVRPWIRAGPASTAIAWPTGIPRAINPSGFPPW